MSQEQPTVFVVDDDPSILRSLDRMFRVKGYRVECFSQPQAVLERAPWSGPGCVVVDLRMPALNGLELQQALRRAGWHTPLVFISAHGDVPTAVQAMKEGAVDFLPKPFTTEELVRAVERALAQDRLARSAREERERLRGLFATLSPRESQVCQLAARGLIDKQIAAELGTVEQTVGQQRRRVLEKLSVTSVAELARLLERFHAEP